MKKYILTLFILIFSLNSYTQIFFFENQEIFIKINYENNLINIMLINKQKIDIYVPIIVKFVDTFNNQLHIYLGADLERMTDYKNFKFHKVYSKDSLIICDTVNNNYKITKVIIDVNFITNKLYRKISKIYELDAITYYKKMIWFQFCIFDFN